MGSQGKKNNDLMLVLHIMEAFRKTQETAVCFYAWVWLWVDSHGEIGLDQGVWSNVKKWEDIECIGLFSVGDNTEWVHLKDDRFISVRDYGYIRYWGHI